MDNSGSAVADEKNFGHTKLSFRKPGQNALLFFHYITETRKKHYLSFRTQVCGITPSHSFPLFERGVFVKLPGKMCVPFFPDLPRNRQYGLLFVPDFLPYVAMRLTSRRRLLYPRNKSGQRECRSFAITIGRSAYHMNERPPLVSVTFGVAA